MRQIVPGLFEIDEIGDTVHCYLWVWKEGLTLIDTGHPGEGQKILDAIVKRGYALHNVRRIIITHVDLDHTGGLAAIKKATGARVACHTVEKVLLEHPERRTPAAWYLRPLFALITLFPGYHHPPVTPDELLVDGQELAEGFTVVHTPGHTPGHVVFYHGPSRLAIVGDVLFQGSIGRTDFPRGNHSDLINAITQKLWPLGDDVTFIPGHGPTSQFGYERRNNMFVADDILAAR